MRAEAEPDMSVRHASDIEGKRVIENPVVPICRHFPNGQFIAGLKRSAMKLDVPRHCAALVDGRCGPANDLLDGRAHPIGRVAQTRQLLWVFHQGPQPIAKSIARRLRAGGEKENEEVDQFFVRQLPIVFVGQGGVDDGRQNIVSRVAPFLGEFPRAYSGLS